MRLDSAVACVFLPSGIWAPARGTYSPQCSAKFCALGLGNVVSFTYRRQAGRTVLVQAS